MSDATRHIVCPNCEAVNRVPTARKASDAKCGRCHKALFAGHPAPATAASFDKQIHANDIPVLVDFWAEWCGPCRAMAPTFERLAKELEPEIRFLKVDTEREPGLAARYNIRSIPTLMLFHRGEVAAQRAGAVDAPTLRAWLRQHTQPAT